MTSPLGQSHGGPQEPEPPRGSPAIARRVTGLAIGVLALPAAWLLLFAAIVVRARLALGDWPHPRRGHPFLGTLEYPMDPKVMPVHHALIWWGLPLAMLAFVLAPLLLFLGVCLGSPRRSYWAMLWLVQATAFFMLLAVDPGEFGRWFSD